VAVVQWQRRRDLALQIPGARRFHNTPLISTLVIGLVQTFAFGIPATRLPPIAG